MPGYGILGPDEGRGLLPWIWAAERLEGSQSYWLGTTRPDGRPHAMPVWGVWVADSFYFSRGQRAQKARNLRANRNCVVCTESDGEALVMEGIAEEISDPSFLHRAVAAYDAKYGWKLDPGRDPVYVVHPRVAFGFVDKPGEFVGSATRWQFGGR
jgi:nitroimidazol reductase NimA-like FMN-containing flavoprotein (pyridoxamine 5'-phosphate oxidase superfamily)